MTLLQRIDFKTKFTKKDTTEEFIKGLATMNFTFWNGIDKNYNPKGSNLDFFFLKTYWFWD